MKLKLALVTLIALANAAPVLAGGYHYVRPYVRQDGTMVQGHMRGNPDGIRENNLNYGRDTGGYNPYGRNNSYGTWGSDND